MVFQVVEVFTAPVISVARDDPNAPSDFKRIPALPEVLKHIDSEIKLKLSVTETDEHVGDKEGEGSGSGQSNIITPK